MKSFALREMAKENNASKDVSEFITKCCGKIFQIIETVIERVFK